MPPLIDLDSAATSAPRMRASDTDRLTTVERLQDAVARGLLTPDEGSERMADAFAAIHLTDLDPLTEDLPPTPPERTAPGWRSLGALAVEQVRTSVTSATGRLGTARVAVVLLVTSLVLVLVGALGGVALSDSGGGGGGDGGWHEYRHPHWDDDRDHDWDD
ncbi:protein of unknown function [Geodermatophilus obscurus]|uniref:DUF1707 domain-containing protein n=1 Tax=Geodermatophilus obscurus TaxID=1861 RepID=A0A1M7RV76_9ACTN|nr:DUF1707 domain-containing protein [Geodermatophilus obscurus]SHN50100.1 protein of unknown function [Geodermatophilus obscurus]